MSFTPSPMQTLVLFRLVFTGEEPKLSELPQLKPGPRRELVGAGFIELEKRGRAQHILLTERAWAWVAENLDAKVPRQARTLEAFEGLLRKLQNYLQTCDVALAEFVQATVQPPPTAGDLFSRIRSTYLQLSEGAYGVKVRLKDLRPRIAGVRRAELDDALMKLQARGAVVLMPLDDPESRTAADEQAAIDILGNKRHILYMEG